MLRPLLLLAALAAAARGAGIGESNRLPLRIVPRVGYSPESSLRLGILTRISSYPSNSDNHDWALTVDATGSLLPTLIPGIELDLARIPGFGGTWRLASSLRLKLHPNETFAGFGASDAATGSDFANQTARSTYRKTHVRAQSTAFIPLADLRVSRLQVAAGASVEQLWTAESDTNAATGAPGRLALLAPFGSRGGTWATLRLGLLLEGRDVPAYARKGFAEELWWEEHAGPFTELKESRRLTAVHKHYLPLLPDLVWAQRLVFDALFGDWPFFLAERTGGERELTAFGGGDSLRGLAPFRYQGPVKFLGSTELRWHLRPFDLSLFKALWQFELTAFADFGRVWRASDPFWGEPWHLGWGGGARILWGRDFVIALDLAFLGDRFGGVYFSVGQVF